MSQWQTLWTFKTTRFTIEWRIAPDDDVDTSFDESGETDEKLASGEWTAFGSEVRVLLDGAEVGSASLWGSIYANPADFRDHIGLALKSRADGRNYGSYFADLVREAVQETRERLANPPKLRRAA